MVGRRFVKILKVEDREEIAKSDFAAPGTVGEQRADTAHQAADRALVERVHALEREWTVLNSEFYAYHNARNRAVQLAISQRMDAIQAELHLFRPMIASVGPQANAGGEQVAKTDRQRGAEALSALMHTPSLKKTDLPEPFELDNSMGVRSQPIIK